MNSVRVSPISQERVQATRYHDLDASRACAVAEHSHGLNQIANGCGMLGVTGIYPCGDRDLKSGDLLLVAF
jgi:hypothetical protein